MREPPFDEPAGFIEHPLMLFSPEFLHFILYEPISEYRPGRPAAMFFYTRIQCDLMQKMLPYPPVNLVYSKDVSL